MQPPDSVSPSVLAELFGRADILPLSHDQIDQLSLCSVEQIVAYSKSLGVSERLLTNWQRRMRAWPDDTTQDHYLLQRFPFTRLLPTPMVTPPVAAADLDDLDRAEQAFLSKFSSQKPVEYVPDKPAAPRKRYPDPPRLD